MPLANSASLKEVPIIGYGVLIRESDLWLTKGCCILCLIFMILINQQYFTDVIFSVTCNALLCIFFSTSGWSNWVKYFYCVLRRSQPDGETLFMSYWCLWQRCTSYFGCFWGEVNFSSCALSFNAFLLLWCMSLAELKAYRRYRNLVYYPISFPQWSFLLTECLDIIVE